jgi:hypothetical protein
MINLHDDSHDESEEESQQPFRWQMRYPRRWAIAFWISAVVLVWLVAYAVEQGEVLLAQRQATAEVTEWLVANSTPEERILAEYAIAGRISLPLTHTTSVEGIRPWLNTLQQEQPEWVVGDGSLAWQLLSQSIWFSRRYQLAHERPPYAIWQRTAVPQPPPIPSTPAPLGGIQVVGSHIAPLVVQVGQDVAVTLALAATGAISRPVALVVEMRPLGETTAVATTSRPIPSEIPLAWWDAPLVVQERFWVDVSGQMARGTYVVVVVGGEGEVVVGEVVVE